MRTFYRTDAAFVLSEACQLTVNSEDLYEDADLETQHFIEAAIAYQNSEADADLKVGLSIDWEHSHTWKDVLEEIDKVAESRNDTSSLWGKVRKAFRSIGNNNKILDSWLKLLPTDSHYFSIVCGGLKLILGVRPSVSP